MPANPKINLLELTPPRLKQLIRELGEPETYAGIILRGIYRDCAGTVAVVSGLSEKLRHKLEQIVEVGSLSPQEEMVSSDRTRKVLMRLEDGKTVESALMQFEGSGAKRERRTVCVSTQVGCAVGCCFCATGQQGFERNLTTAEIIEQVIYFLRESRDDAKSPKPKGSRGWLTNVVFMGMGEPLANYENVMQAVEILNAPAGLGLGARQVTISTSGLVPQIRRLALEKPHCELAVSLHAANDELRSRLVPVNRQYPIEDLVAACHDYSAATGKNIYYEYALFKGVNDSLTDADELVRLLNGSQCSVNLIAGNATNSNSFKPSTSETAKAFQKVLIEKGIRAMLRVSRGADIDAGCGQLRSRWIKKQPPAG
jgi:23S rRNA (adenine2503-C2)-methyltransferase